MKFSFVFDQYENHLSTSGFLLLPIGVCFLIVNIIPRQRAWTSLTKIFLFLVPSMLSLHLPVKQTPVFDNMLIGYHFVTSWRLFPLQCKGEGDTKVRPLDHIWHSPFRKVPLVHIFSICISLLFPQWYMHCRTQPMQISSNKNWKVNTKGATATTLFLKYVKTTIWKLLNIYGEKPRLLNTVPCFYLGDSWRVLNIISSLYPPSPNN